MPHVKWRMSNSRLLLAVGIRHLPLTVFFSLSKNVVPRPDFSGDFILRVARLSRNVGQPDHILANPIISHKAERRPGRPPGGRARTSWPLRPRCDSLAGRGVPEHARAQSLWECRRASESSRRWFSGRGLG